MPDAGQTTVAQLDTGNSPLHSTAGGGVTVVECNMRSGGFLVLAMGFEDELLNISCTTAGAWALFDNSAIITGATTAPVNSVTYRIEVTTTAVRFYIDNALIHTRSGGVPAGYGVTYAQMAYYDVAGTPGYAAGSTQLAFGYLHLKTEVASGPLGGPTLGSSADTAAPTFVSATIVVSAQYDQYTVTWPSATDNNDTPIELIYEYRVDGGAWTSNGNSTTLTRTGRTPGSTEALDIRVKDTAGNTSAALSTTISLFPLPTTVQLFGDNFTLASVLRGSSGQTGKWAGSLWSTTATYFGRGGDNIPGNEQPESWVRSTDAPRRTADGLEWLGEGDVTTIAANVHPVTPAEVELPLVMEVGAWGDFHMRWGGPSLPGVINASASLANMSDGTARVYANIPPGAGWVAGAPSGPNYCVVPALAKNQYNVLRIERTLVEFRVYLNGVLLGTAPQSSPSATPKILDWGVSAYTQETGVVTAARGLTMRGETLLKFDYVNLYAGRLEETPLGPPRDPNDDPPPPEPGSEPGPGNEPKDGYSSFWTAFNRAYEVP